MTDTFNGQIIDAWAQPVLKEGILPEVVRLFQQSGSAHLLGKELAAEQFVGLMDEAGVGRVMLSAWHRPGKWVISNDTVAEMVRQFPQRLVGVAAVNLEKPVEAVRELERAVKELGFKALRVVPWLWNRPPMTSSTFRFTSNVSNWAFHFVPRWAILVRSCLQKRAVLFLMSPCSQTPLLGGRRKRPYSSSTPLPPLRNGAASQASSLKTC